MSRIWLSMFGLLAALAICRVEAQNAPLPQGNNGLAARYPGDAGIGSDPAVIFADDFESYSNPSGLTTRWSNASTGSNVRIATESGNFFAGAKAVELTIPVTSTETGLTLTKFLSPERDVLFLRTYSRYGSTFNVQGSSHNGPTIEAHYCCPGVPADGTNKIFVGMEAARFESNTPIPGFLAFYMYHPLQRDLYGDHFFPTGVVSPFTNTPFDFGPDFVSRPNVVPELGRWYSYELMVKMNTPGLRDGRIAAWLDGVLIADFTNLRLRDTTSLTLDKFTVGLHVNRNTVSIARKWYDNVVAATSYIGPLAPSNAIVPNPPTNLLITN